MARKKPTILVLGYGNPGRLDDGLGPALAENIGRLALPGVTAESAYQLNIEDAALIAGFGVVVFADAAVTGDDPGFFRRLLGRPAASCSSHVMRPEAVVALAAEALGFAGRAYLLGVRGYAFNEYEERLSERAQRNLASQAAMLARALAGHAAAIDSFTTGGPIDDSAAACNAACGCHARPAITASIGGEP